MFGGNFGLLNDGLERDACQIVAIQIDVESSELRFDAVSSRPFGSPCVAPWEHRALNTNQDDGSAAVRFQDFVRQSVQSACTSSAFIS